LQQYGTTVSGVRISVVIIAQDEQRTIGRVLESVRPIAWEVILVDSGSTDRTKEIASSYGVQPIHQDWLGYAAQKNFAISQASGDWILSLDADEEVTPALASEIKELFEKGVPSEINGYKIPRLFFIGETAVRRGGFYPDAQLRLIKKGSGQFKDRIVHESIVISGESRELRNPMNHYAYRDVEHFEQTLDKYARLSAQHYYSQEFSPWRAHVLNETFHPLWTFFYRFIIRQGFLDGALCLKLNLIYANYVRKKIRYLRELAVAQKQS
jgi:glycosyltransferase involved in cell wall biosynthesis